MARKKKNENKNELPPQQESQGEVFLTPLEEVLPNSMLPYAEYVILDRALPRVEDGLKPVQRRILYTMYDMGLTPDKPHKKSARIVGECMGKYHPHGDSSVYDAMVRMAQDFNMRMTLVNGHGNFGSVDGDPAAAMRYTEARLEPLALELLRDIEKDTVRFGLNFDDSLKEPETLPGRFPNLLVNGASGIAVGLATNIPPHNLGEVIDGVVAYINNPRIKLFEMMKYIKAPDFPTGGYIIANELLQAYETGRGKITLRAKVSVEEGDNDKKLIVISELPYQVNKAKLLTKIADLREEKKDILGGISEITDESDRNGMRAVIKVKKDADVDKILAALYKFTDLECSFGINMVAIADGKPQQMGLLDIIKHYVAYQREVVLRRTKFDLAQAKERCHILEGLIIAVRNIDEVIQIIKTSESVPAARQRLRDRFDLSERQAQAILDLRLARLTKLEIYKLEQELEELKKLIARLTAIVESKKLQMDVVAEELREIKKAYKSERKSSLVFDIADIKVEKFDDVRPVEKCVLVYTADDKIKVVQEKNFNMSDKNLGERSTLSDVLKLQLHTSTDKVVYSFTNMGNCYKIDFEDIEPGKLKDKGMKYSDLCPDAQEGEKPVYFTEVGDKMPKGSLLFYSKLGYVKKSDWKEYNILKYAFQAVKVNEGDEIIGIEQDDPEPTTTLFFVTAGGMCLNAYKNDIPTQGRISAGVRGINLGEGDYVVFAGQIDGEGEIIVATDGNTIKKVIASQIDPMARYRKGVRIVDLGKGRKVAYSDYVTEPYKFAVQMDDGSLVQADTEENITIEDRNTKGKNIKLKKGCKAVAFWSMKYIKS